MRKVMYKKWIPAEYDDPKSLYPIVKAKTGCYTDEFNDIGVFHCWGVNCEQSHENYGNFTVGIIEKENGEMVTSIPERMKFIN